MSVFYVKQSTKCRVDSGTINVVGTGVLDCPLLSADDGWSPLRIKKNIHRRGGVPPPVNKQKRADSISARFCAFYGGSKPPPYEKIMLCVGRGRRPRRPVISLPLSGKVARRASGEAVTEE